MPVLGVWQVSTKTLMAAAASPGPKMGISSLGGEYAKRNFFIMASLKSVFVVSAIVR